MVEMEDMKGEKIKKGENRNPKKKGAEKGRGDWDDLLVVWDEGLVFLVVSGVSVVDMEFGSDGLGQGNGWEFLDHEIGRFPFWCLDGILVAWKEWRFLF